AAEPMNRESRTPLSPEPSPIYLIMISLGTHTSRSPRSTKTGGIMKSSSTNDRAEIESAVMPMPLLKTHNRPTHTSTTRKLLYLLIKLTTSAGHLSNDIGDEERKEEGHHISIYGHFFPEIFDLYRHRYNTDHHKG